MKVKSKDGTPYSQHGSSFARASASMGFTTYKVTTLGSSDFALSTLLNPPERAGSEKAV